MKSFSRKTIQLLKHYVYALVDPENEEIFYVGRGKGTRALDHLKIKANSKNTKKNQRIKSIRARRKGEEPRVDILRYGLSKDEAQEVEAAIIDTIGISNLTNIVKGYGTDHGRSDSISLNTKLGGRPLDIKEFGNTGVLLFFCHKSLAGGYNIYDCTRQFWNVSGTKIKKRDDKGNLHYKYAFGMKGNTVLEVFRIIEWFPAGTTVSTRECNSDGKNEWEFIGSYANPQWSKFKNRILHENSEPLKASQIGFRYIN